MIPIAKPLLGKEEEEAIKFVLRTGIIAQGPKVKEFEEKFASYIGSKYAIATNSGTSALHTTLLAYGSKKDDEIITTPFSFIATANSILFTGAKPVFVDIKEDFNINPDLIEDKITEKTKAIIPVHLYGNPCDIKRIIKIASDNDLVVIEDCAQAHGAFVDNKKVGSFSTGCFSFYPTKNMTTIEGGIITTDDKEVYKKSRMIRTHGSKTKYNHVTLGYNFRMSDISAAIGIEQLKKLDNFNKKRRENANYLNENLKDINWLVLPKIVEGHVFHQYTIRVKKDREKVMETLNKNGVGNSIFYPLPIYKQKLYQNLFYKDNLPVVEKISKEVLSLPVHPSLNKEDLDKIISVLRSVKL